MTKSEHNRARREAMREKGLCTTCETHPLAPGNRTRCERCKRDKANQAWLNRDERRAAGRCIECPARAEAGKGRCRACLDKARNYQRQVRASGKRAPRKGRGKPAVRVVSSFVVSQAGRVREARSRRRPRA